MANVDTNPGLQALLRIQRHLGSPRAAVIDPKHEKLLADIRCAKDELKRLAAIEAKLLRTRDGHPIAPETEYFVRTGFGPQVVIGRTFHLGSFTPNMHGVLLMVDGRAVNYDQNRVYAAREAAESDARASA